MRRIAIALPAAALGAALLAAPVGAQSPDIAPLSNNDWVEITAAQSQRHYPLDRNCPGDQITSANPIGRAFSGIVYGDGQIFFFGGGHGGHPGNDVEIYNITANKWFQQYAPECCDAVDGDACQAINGGSGTPILSADGIPLVEHTYQYMAYDTSRHRLVGRLTPGTWAFDSSTQEWTVLAGDHASPPTFSPHYNASNSLLLYDSALDRFINFGRFGNNASTRKVFEFNPQTNEWTFKLDLPQGFEFEAIGAYDPDTRQHILVSKNHPGAKKWWKYNQATNSLTEITASVPNSLKGGDKLGIAYDTRNDAMVILQSSGETVDVWVHDLGDGTWTPLPRPSPAPSGASNIAKWGNFVYDPQTNAFFLLYWKNGSGGTGGAPSATHLWAYRYRINDDPIDPVDVPAPPTGVAIQ